MQYNVDLVYGTDPQVSDVINFRARTIQESGESDVAFHDPPQEEDRWAFHAIARDQEGNVVAVMRFNLLSHVKDSPFWLDQICAPKLTKAIPDEEIAYGSRFFMSPQLRGSGLTPIFIHKLSVLFVEKGIRPRAIVTCANPGVARLYYKFGFRPLAKGCWSQIYPAKGFIFPLILLLSDQYLVDVRSPLVLLFPPDQAAEKAAKVLQGMFPLFAANDYSGMKPAQEIKNAKAPVGAFHGLSKEEIAEFIAGCPQIEVPHGCPLLRQGQQLLHDWFVLLSGELVVVVPNDSTHQVRTLVPGMTVGEFRALGLPQRSADVIAVRDSRLVCLAPALLTRVKSGIAAKVALNLARMLSGWLVESQCNHVGSVLSDSPANSSPADSYSKQILSNEAFKLETLRLERQAGLFKVLELNALKSIGLHDGCAVVDVGCGTGHVSIILAQECPNSSVIGIDINESLWSIGRSLVARMSLDSRVAFVPGSGDNIPLGTNSVDFAYSRLVMQHVEKPVDIVREMARIVKPGGKVCVLDIDDDFSLMYPSLPGMDEIKNRVAQIQAKLGGNRFVGRRLFQTFKASGLDNVEVKLVPLSLQQVPADAYFQVVFGFRKQLMEEHGMNEFERRLFDDLQKLLLQPDTFASVIVFFVSGTVPHAPRSRV